MGKQYKKLIKRRRRAAYLARRKAAANVANPSTSKKAKAPAKKAKAPAKKATRKKAAAVEKAEPLAEKAKAEDVLGPDVATEEQPKEEQASSASEDSKE